MNDQAQQLQMIMPENALQSLPPVRVQEDVAIRNYRCGEDDDAFIELLHSGGFDTWDRASLAAAQQDSLPDGMFVAINVNTGVLLATAMAGHKPCELHPFGGELGWVATRPEARSKGLGRSVCTASLMRFRAAGYHRIYLKTDDWRLPAIHLYLKMGFEPFLFADDMPDRWQNVCRELAWQFNPERWARK